MEIWNQTNMILSVGIGLVCGLIPLVLGTIRARFAMAVTGFVLCTIGGVVAGWVFAIPLAIVFTIIIESANHKSEMQYLESKRLRDEKNRINELERMEKERIESERLQLARIIAEREARDNQIIREVSLKDKPTGFISGCHPELTELVFKEGFEYVKLSATQLRDGISITSIPSGVFIQLDYHNSLGVTPIFTQISSGRHTIQGNLLGERILSGNLILSESKLSIDKSSNLTYISEEDGFYHDNTHSKIDDISSILKDIIIMYEKGLLSEDEFAKAKKRILK